MTFRLFSLPHLAILCLVPVLGAGAALLVRGGRKREKPVRFVLGTLVAANELTWYAYVLWHGWVILPFGLPLDLCDMVLWLTVFVLFTKRAWAFDLVYYWGFAGTTMALLTPDLGAPFASYITVKFFLSHGVVVASLLFLSWSGCARPRPRSWWKALLWLQVYALGIGLFNFAFHTNYFYLCTKPSSGSLLDYFGEWPWYLFWSDVIAAGLFFLLWMPFRRQYSTQS